DKFALNPWQLEIVSVATLTHRAAAKQAGKVTNDHHGSISGRRCGNGLGEARAVVIVDVAAARHRDVLTELVTEALDERGSLETEFDTRALRKDVVGKGVATEECLVGI